MNNIKTSDETYIAAKAILESQITEAGASVFILSGLIDYEGGRVLGAYSTISAAKQARDAYIARVRADVKNGTYKNSAFDDYSIEEKSLNAPPKGLY